MRRIAKITAIQTAIRRGCSLAREFTGLEVMPDELGAACAPAMTVLGMIWDEDKISKRKPNSVVNVAACMAAMAWSHAVKKVPNKEYSLNVEKITGELGLIYSTLDDLFPGIMSVEGSEQCVYDGVCATADGIEKNGWQWTKKLNEPMVCLMSLYPIIRALGLRSAKLNEIVEEFTKGREGKDKNGTKD